MITFSYDLNSNSAEDIITSHCKKFDPKLHHLIIGYYSEPGRFYHNVNHIASMLINSNKFTPTKELILAILFHDIIIDNDSAPAEVKSALFASKYLEQLQMIPKNIKEVDLLIRSTQYSRYPISFYPDILREELALIRMLDLVELFHLNSALHNDNLIYKESTHYFKLSTNDYIQRRRKFLDILLSTKPPFTERFTYCLSLELSDPEIIYSNLSFSLDNLEKNNVK